MSLYARTSNSRGADSAHPADRFLGLGQVVLLVMGGTIGADVYVASALGAHLGSSGLFVWAAGAVMAMAVIMAFAVCALVVPDTGGPYLYARRAFGPLAGFLAGWAVLAAQWAALVALPVAFSGYLQTIVGQHAWLPWYGAATRVMFLAAVALAVCHGPRLTALINDILTVARLVPLLLVLVAGLTWAALHPTQALDHLSPLRPPPLRAGCAMLVPVFWAYAGFEVGSIPAGQVKEPRRTIPLGLILGMAAASAIYLVVNFTTALVVPPSELVVSPAPLMSCARGVAAGLLPFWPQAPGAAELLLGIGVLVSILGTATAVAFAVTYLVAAMASARLLPPALGRVHPRLGTPVTALLVLTVPAALASMASGLLSIVSTAVVCSAFAYLATALAAWRLNPTLAGRLLAALATAACLILLSLTELGVLAAGAGLLALGGLLYALRRHLPAPAPGVWVETFTPLVALAPEMGAARTPAMGVLRAPAIGTAHAPATPGFVTPGLIAPPSWQTRFWQTRFVPAAASFFSRLRPLPRPRRRLRIPG
ncbi:MAG: APC family permease [Firmicutes bacterium]|nr:APC family permease [Bacillota bacterium]